MSGALKRDEWETVRLGDYISLIRGVSYSPNDVGNDASVDCTPILRANNIHEDKLNFDDLVYIHNSKITTNQLIKEGDIIVCASSGSKQLVGKSARANQDYPYSFGAFCKVVRIHNNINSRYLGHYFGSHIYRRLISELSQGANINNLRNEHIENISIPLPPLDIQRRIADTLDKVTELITLRKTQLKKLDELVKARFVEMFGDPIDNPMKWDCVNLCTLSSKITNGTTPKGGSQVYVDEGITFFRSQNVWKNRLEYEDIAYIDYETNANMRDSCLKHGDLLITKTGRINTENSSLGRAALFLGKDDSANINGHVYLVRLLSSVSRIFVLHILISDSYRRHIRRVCVGGIDKRQLNKNHIEEFPIILPPLSLQNSFASFVSSVEEAKAPIQQSLDTLETLKKSLIQEYFG